MDIPITLRFFEKLNLYQDVRKLDRKNIPEWVNQRRILLWAGDLECHRHRATKLTVDHAFEHDEITGITGQLTTDRTKADEKRGYIIHACFGNLVSGGLATWSNESNREEGICFTRDGFLMGEVINEIEGHRFKKCLYGSLYWFAWLIFVCGALIILGGAVKMVHDIWALIAVCPR